MCQVRLLLTIAILMSSAVLGQTTVVRARRMIDVRTGRVASPAVIVVSNEYM